jgi:hypothetical protein
VNHCARCGAITADRLCSLCNDRPPRPVPPARSTTAIVRPRQAGHAYGPRPPRLSAMLVGRVVTEPTTSASGVGPDGIARALVLPLAIIAVLTNGVLVEHLLVTAIVIIVVLWLLRRIGIDGLMFVSLISSMWRGARGARGPRTGPPALTFRYDEAGLSRSVRLIGHDSGVHLGDRVRVRGVEVRGTIHAIEVVDVTTGARLRRSGMARLAMLGLIDLWLFIVIVTQVAGR